MVFDDDEQGLDNEGQGLVIDFSILRIIKNGLSHFKLILLFSFQY